MSRISDERKERKRKRVKVARDIAVLVFFVNVSIFAVAKLTGNGSLAGKALLALFLTMAPVVWLAGNDDGDDGPILPWWTGTGL